MNPVRSLVDRINTEAAQAARPGQMARLEAIAAEVAELIAERDYLKARA